ncbi:hypothetical protein P3S68_026947 [Capsicum galapagoense]
MVVKHNGESKPEKCLVEYTLEDVRKDIATVGVRGTNTIVLEVEKKSTPRLQDSRPFGLSTLIIGFDPYTRTPSLYQIDPSGTLSAGKANAIGRNSNSIRDFLEKNYKETSGQETVKLAIRTLLRVVESGGKNIEVTVMTKEHGLRQLEEAEIDAIIAEIEAKKAALLKLQKRLLQKET